MISRPATTAAVLALAITFSFHVKVAAQRNETNGFQSVVDRAVIKELKRQKIVGAAVGLISDSKVIYTKGYGFADLEQQIPFDDETLINWASNSKPVMGILAMQLVQNGKLDLDKTINHYLPDLPIHLHTITPRHLLCHQSGMPHYSNGKIIPDKDIKGDETDPKIALGRFIKSPLIFQPGEKKDYSSYAYVLLSAVVQAVGDEPIQDQLATRITKPLGMTSFQLDFPFEDQKNWSKAYGISNGNPVELGDQANYWKHGAGGYKSNIKDFTAFANSFIKKKLINGKSFRMMTTPQSTTDGKATSIGLGIYTKGKAKDLKLWHGGSQPETRTRMVIYPNQRHAVVAMCNCRHADPGKITTAIYGALKSFRARNN